MSTKRTPEVIEQSLQRVKEDKLFGFVKGLNKDAKYFDPDSDKVDSSVFDSYLKESMFQDSRDEMRLTFSLLHDLVSNSKALGEFVAHAEQAKNDAEKLLEENLSKIMEKTEPMYQPLAEMDLYYRNTGLDKIENLTLITMDSGLWEDDPDDEIFKTLYEEIVSRSEEIDKRNSVGYVVMPNFPGKTLLSRLADITYKSKATLVTGYRDLPDVETTMNFLANDKIGGSEPKWGNVIVIGNSATTKEGVRLSPAAALAGRLHVNILSQPVAGLTNGSLAIEGLRYNVSQPELKLFKKNGVIPMVTAFDADLGFGTWTAFKGEDIEFQHYSVVRTLNWISRSLCHHLNKCTHEIATTNRMTRINTQVVGFLKQLERHNIIRKGEVARFELDDERPDIVHIDLDITPLYAIRLFALSITAKNGSDADDELSQ